MDNETPSFEELMDKALRLFEISAVRDPETAQLGMLITERPGVPSDQYCTVWFDNAQQLSEFISDCFPFRFCEFESIDEIDSSILDVADKIKTAGLYASIRYDLLELNDYLLSWVRIRWVGTFNEMCS